MAAVAKHDDAPRTQPGPPPVEKLPSVDQEIKDAKGQLPSFFDGKPKQFLLTPKSEEDEGSGAVNLPSECAQPVGLALAWPNGEETFTLADPQYTLSEARDSKSALVLVISAPLGSLDPEGKPLVNLEVRGRRLFIKRIERDHDALINNVINALEYSEFLVRTKDGLKQYCLDKVGEKLPVSDSGGLYFVFDRPNLPRGFDVKNIMVDAVDGAVGKWKSSHGQLPSKFTCPLSSGKIAAFTVTLDELLEGGARWQLHVDNRAFFVLKEQKTATTQATTQDNEVSDWETAYNTAFKVPFTLSLRLPNGVEVRQIGIGPLPQLAP
jgi:hypothetical protein